MPALRGAELVTEDCVGRPRHYMSSAGRNLQSAAWAGVGLMGRGGGDVAQVVLTIAAADPPSSDSARGEERGGQRPVPALPLGRPAAPTLPFCHLSIITPGASRGPNRRAVESGLTRAGGSAAWTEPEL